MGIIPQRRGMHNSFENYKASRNAVNLMVWGSLVVSYVPHPETMHDIRKAFLFHFDTLFYKWMLKWLCATDQFFLKAVLINFESRRMNYMQKSSQKSLLNNLQ